MSEKYGFFEPSALFRFEFTFPSLIWGISVGALISMHKFHNCSNLYLENWSVSVKQGLVVAFLSASSIWGYHFFNFTVSQHIIQQQSYARQESSLKAQYIEEYFKQKFSLESSSREEFNMNLNSLDETWKKLEKQLSVSETNSN